MDLKQFIEDTKRKLNSLERRVNNLSGGAGQANTASNIGVGGVGPYQQKVGVDLQFRNIAPGSAKIGVALDAPNNEVEVDLGVVNLNDLADINAGAPNDNDALTWDTATGRWIPEAAGGASESAIQFLDNFNDASRHWGWCDQANNGTIVEAANVLTLAVANGVDGRIGDGGRNRGPHAALGHPGAPFEFKCKLDSYTVNDYTHAGLFISVDTWAGFGSCWLFFGRARDSGSAVNGLGAWGNGGWLNTNAVVAMPIYLRIRLAALNLACACYTMDYSTDDITYNNLRTATIFTDLLSNSKDGLCVGVFGRNGVGAAVYNAISAPIDWYYQRRSFGPG